MLVNFFSALALVFVIEGMLPFAFPKAWKRFLISVIGQEEKVLRISGLISMMAGVLLLTIVHQFAE
jgi:uncharacterized protein